MKRLYLSGALIPLAVVILGQVPQAFNYQAILRNSDGSVKANESVCDEWWKLNEYLGDNQTQDGNYQSFLVCFWLAWKNHSFRVSNWSSI